MAATMATPLALPWEKLDAWNKRGDPVWGMSCMGWRGRARDKLRRANGKETIKHLYSWKLYSPKS
eukprot:11159517-Lingulodinium_polyedra.AAC.1